MVVFRHVMDRLDAVDLRPLIDALEEPQVLSTASDTMIASRSFICGTSSKSYPEYKFGGKSSLYAKTSV